MSFAIAKASFLSWCNIFVLSIFPSFFILLFSLEYTFYLLSFRTSACLFCATRQIDWSNAQCILLSNSLALLHFDPAFILFLYTSQFILLFSTTPLAGWLNLYPYLFSLSRSPLHWMDKTLDTNNYSMRFYLPVSVRRTILLVYTKDLHHSISSGQKCSQVDHEFSDIQTTFYFSNLGECSIKCRYINLCLFYSLYLYYFFTLFICPSFSFLFSYFHYYFILFLFLSPFILTFKSLHACIVSLQPFSSPSLSFTLFFLSLFFAFFSLCLLLLHHHSLSHSPEPSASSSSFSVRLFLFSFFLANQFPLWGVCVWSLELKKNL